MACIVLTEHILAKRLLESYVYVLVLNCVYSLSSLDIDPVVVEVRLYTHDSAASVYLNINTTISDTGLSLSFRVIGAVGYI